LAGADSDGSGPDAPSPRIKVRIESLSDLVFGLALSIGSLFLVSKVPQTSQDLEVNVLLFGFGFLIVVLTWLGYTRAMAVLPVEAPFALFTNLVLLFVVALEPYLFYVLESVKTLDLLDSASVAYALDLGGMFFMQGTLAYMVVKQDRAGSAGRRRVHPDVVARFRRRMRLDAVVGVVFVVSALPIFSISSPMGSLRFYIWGSYFVVELGVSAIRRLAKRV